jgi:hypothetical protein
VSQPWRSGSDGESGAAVIEFVLVFVALVVPLVYVIAVMAEVQRAVLAVSTAAREMGRVYVTAPTRVEADARMERAYREVMGNFGYPPGDARADIEINTSCPTEPEECAGGFGPGAEVSIRVTYRVPVARLPFVGAVAGPDLPVGASHHTRVDRYRRIGP